MKWVPHPIGCFLREYLGSSPASLLHPRRGMMGTRNRFDSINLCAAKVTAYFDDFLPSQTARCSFDDRLHAGRAKGIGIQEKRNRIQSFAGHIAVGDKHVAQSVLPGQTDCFLGILEKDGRLCVCVGDARTAVALGLLDDLLRRKVGAFPDGADLI